MKSGGHAAKHNEGSAMHEEEGYNLRDCNPLLMVTAEENERKGHSYERISYVTTWYLGGRFTSRQVRQGGTIVGMELIDDHKPYPSVEQIRQGKRQERRRKMRKDNHVPTMRELEEQKGLDIAFLEEEIEMNSHLPQGPVERRIRSKNRYNTKEARRRRFLQRFGRVPTEEITKEGEAFLGVIETHADEIENPVRGEELAKQLDSVRKSVVESFRSVQDFTVQVDDPELQKWLHAVECMVVYAYDIARARTFTDLMIATASLAQKHTKRSVVYELFRLFNNWNTVDPQSDEEGLSTLQMLDLVRSHEIPKKISYLISAAMSICACEMTDVEWTIGGLELIKFEALHQQVKALDLIDALVRTFQWFIETGTQVMKTGSLAPILYSKPSMAAYHQTYLELIRDFNKSMHEADHDVPVYLEKLDKCIKDTANLAKVSKESLKLLYQRNYEKLLSMKEQVCAQMKGAEMRVAPFGMSLFGNSSVGKSTVAKLVMQQALTAGGYIQPDRTVDWHRVVTHDAYDEYDSTMFGSVLGLYMDDVANAKADRTKANPARNIIRFFNNIAAPAIKAELNLKGVVFINFKVGVITTNKKSLDANIYSNCPESILRRMYHTTVVVKQEYTKSDGIQLDSTNPLLANSLIPDAWELKLEEIHTVSLGNDRYSYMFKTMNISEGGRIFNTSKMNIYEYLECVRILAKRHFEQQRNFMKREKEGNKLQALPCGRLPGSPFANDDEQSTCSTVPSILLRQDIETEEASHEDVDRELEVGRDYNTAEEWAEYDKMAREPHSHENKSTVETQSYELISGIVQKAAYGAVKKQVTSIFGPWMYFYKSLHFTPIRMYETRVLQKELERALDTYATPLVYAMIPDWAQETRIGRFLRDRFARGKFYMDTGKVIRRLGYGCAMQAISMLSPRVYDYATRPSTFGSGIGFGSMVFEAMRLGCFSHIGLCNTVCSNLGMSYLLRRRVSMVTLGCVALTSFAAAKIATETRDRIVREEFLARKDAIDRYAEEIRKSCIPKTLLVAGTVILGLKAVSIWNAYRLQSAPHSLTPDDVDKQKSWMGSLLDSIGFKATGKVKNASPTQVCNAVGRNLFTTTYTAEDGKGTCNIVFIKKYVAIVPKHIFYPKGNLTVEPRRFLDFKVRRNQMISSSFKFRINFSTAAEISGKDAVLMFVPNCPDVKDITKWLPEVKGTGLVHAHFLMRDFEGGIETDNVAVQHRHTGHMYMDFDGGDYKTPLARKGACMSILYPDCKNSSILGFHIGGNSENDYGVMQVITEKEFTTALVCLERINEVVISSSAGTMPDKVMDTRVLTSNAVSPMAKIFHELPEASEIDVHGATALRAASKSQVIPSILSESIQEHFGVPNEWGPPKLNPNWKRYNATLEHMIDPIEHFEPEELLRAKRDYERPLLELARKAKDIRPLTDREAVMGQDGKRFVDPMPMNTSMGFPIYGPKRKHFTEVFEEDMLVDRVPCAMITEEVDRMLECWRKNERAYSICTATLKDEPTPLNKEKVRVFQASNVAMSICIRKYFLPIIRFLALHPTLSESGVGVNAMGKQWQDLMDFAKTYSDDGEMVPGDYSKYDVRMSSQLTYMAWTVLIDIAQACGYPEEALTLMRAMVSDIIHAVIEWNGTLITIYNINTSGNNCTVQINGIVNSLLVRMGFFHSCPEKDDFRDHVALITYGDDFLLSRVSEVADRFHFESYKNFLAGKNMKITLPSKTDEVRRSLPFEECDFLKRRSCFIPQINREVGALDEMSIYKSLHANLKSKTATPREVAISCIETAMHEWFAHGEEVYKDRQEKMLKVCAHQGLAVPAAYLTFEERVQRWKDAYDS